MSDLISKKEAIDKINEQQRKLIYCFGFENDIVKIMDIAKSIINAIPSAQPETHEKRTETHGVCLDTISRKAAIDAHYEYCNKHPDASFPVWSLKILENLPSAQPDLEEDEDIPMEYFENGGI